MIKVRNMIGTSDAMPPAGYDSWKEYWEQQMNRRFTNCSCVTCDNSADVGGHVNIIGDYNKYIVPICYAHNNTNDSYYVSEDDLLRI